MLTQKTVLIVEDNPINREMLALILSGTYNVLQAENGEAALAVLNQYGEDISLIIMDVVMPVMDGYACLNVLKKDSRFAAIPVIIATQGDTEADEIAALSHGANDYVTKPYKPQIILHRVAGIIKLRETAAMINLMQYDRLTGLYSKEFFYQRTKELLRQHPDREYDLVCSDVENFKLINDVFGIPAGDMLLQSVAEAYRSKVEDRGICSRFEADRFICLLERHYQYSDDLFAESVNQINDLSKLKNINIKWGIYSIEDRTLPVEQMCDRAFLAVRNIKGQYGKYFAVYDEVLRQKLIREQEVANEMETALAGGQFEVYFQAKYRIRDVRLVGAEALVRWRHPQWGFQSPGLFIPIFEKNGFITTLDRFVWEQSCVALREWDDKGYPPISVSVNVSRADVYHLDLIDTLTGLTEKYGVSPSRLHLEITESAYTEDPGQIVRTVSRLRELGFVIEMDDFGSGYSSLNMLDKMPLDILKLDMKFIQEETARPLSQGILYFIMGLARWMNLRVVAEGVETKEQFIRLREIACDYVQGYYFAKPMPKDQFSSLLAASAAAASQEEEQQQTEEKEILLVADADPCYRAAVRRTFEQEYEVTEATDGAGALAVIASYERKVAAVVLSMTLTNPDALAVLDRLRREKDTWNIIVITTGPKDDILEEQALSVGADDFVSKPHTTAVLKRRVLHARELRMQPHKSLTVN